MITLFFRTAYCQFLALIHYFVVGYIKYFVVKRSST